ncbi:MAG: hypothetical protein JWP57_230 [Spirosoma sp.]|nr:hypothetical protein [Spirosoma sp.]
MHHAQIHIGWMIGIRLPEHPQEISEYRPDF